MRFSCSNSALYELQIIWDASGFGFEVQIFFIEPTAYKNASSKVKVLFRTIWLEKVIATNAFFQNIVSFSIPHSVLVKGPSMSIYQFFLNFIQVYPNIIQVLSKWIEIKSGWIWIKWVSKKILNKKWIKSWQNLDNVGKQNCISYNSNFCTFEINSFINVPKYWLKKCSKLKKNCIQILSRFYCNFQIKITLSTV